MFHFGYMNRYQNDSLIGLIVHLNNTQTYIEKTTSSRNRVSFATAQLKFRLLEYANIQNFALIICPYNTDDIYVCLLIQYRATLIALYMYNTI